MEGGSAAYHLPESVRFSGDLSVAALESSLNTLVSRHETLRTVFQESDGQVWQVIQPESEAVFTLEHIDVSDLSDDDQAERVNIESQAEHQAPFDLATGPLIRGRLLRLSEDDHVLLVTMHHIVSDAWSMGIVTAEINTLYQAYSEDKPNPLAPLALQYADYAVWQRTHISGDALDEQSAYWQRHLVDAPALLNLPTDHPRPAVQSYRGGQVGLELSRELSDRVKALAQRCLLYTSPSPRD